MNRVLLHQLGMSRPSRDTLRLVAVSSLAVLAVVTSFQADAWGRPGGGESYSGSRSSSGSGSGGSSGGDSDGILNIIIWLVFEVPAIGIPLLIAFIGYMIYTKTRSSETSWSTNVPTAATQAVHHQPRSQPRKALERLRAEDANFSLVLFEDFLTFLFAQVHEARGRNAIDELAVYVSDPVRAQLRGPEGIQQVKGIVLGAMRFVSSRLDGPMTEVTVELEANMTEVVRNAEQALYVVERWTLARRRGAQSRSPQNARTLNCPNCGAPRTQLRGNRCFQCNSVVGDGAFDWNVTSVLVAQREARPPLLTGTVEERGTDLPSIVDPEANAGFAALQAKDPALSWPALRARMDLAFRELQVAWSAQDLARARPYLTDAQFQSLWYWVETYRRSGLRNVTEHAQVTNTQLARVTSDRFYDAVTVRIYATGLDYTLDSSGKVVAGNRSRPRPYSEYWTLVRGSQRRGTPRSEPVCPNCGAALAVNMAGTCTYCNVIVTTGEFDWVISRIEQDEAYSG